MSLRVEDCLALNLNLHFHLLPWPLSSLLLANISSLAITLGPNSLHTTNELVLLDSTITSNFHFTNKGFSKLIVEGCTFKKAFKVNSKLAEETAEVPDLVSITGSEFQGKVEMVIKVGRGRNPTDTFILLHNNW